MKKQLIILVSVSLLFSACYSTKQYSRTWLGDIPARNPSAPLKIIYPNDPLPKTDYIEIVKMDLALKGTMNSKRLVNELKAMALHQGLDAIIIQERGSQSFEAPSFGDVMLGVADALEDDPYTEGGYISTHYYQMISGVGIKFIENIDYLNKFIKNEDLYLISDTSNQPTLLASIDYYPSGSVRDFKAINAKAEELYINHIKNYAEYYLLYDQIGKWHEWFSGFRMSRRAKFRLNDWMIKSVRLTYDPVGRIIKLSIKNNENHIPFTEYIKYDRNKYGQIEARKIYRHQKTALLEKYTYDAENRIVAKDIYELENGQEKHILKSIYSYYLNDDINYLLKEKKKPAQNQ